MAVPPLLEVDDLATSFRTEEGVVRAVDGVSFTLEAGQTLGLVGESGSGKSVTNLSILRLIPDPPGRIERGRILLAGRDLLTLSNEEMRHVRGRRVAMIFQDPMTSLNPLLTVSRQLTEVLELHERMAPRTARERALEMLQRVGIPDAGRRLDAYPHQFSGGMRQRVMIAMALLCKPELLLADEPTTALDVTIQAQILTLLRTLSRELKTAVILVTHDLAVVAGMAQRVAVMYAGRIVEHADTATLFERPQHPYTIGLLRSLPARAAAGGAGAGASENEHEARADATGPGTSSEFGAAAQAAEPAAETRPAAGTLPAESSRTGDAPRRRRLASIPGRPPSLARLPPGCPFAPRCPWAFDRCRAERPPLRATVAGSQAACWVDDPGAQPQTQPDLWEAGS